MEEDKGTYHSQPDVDTTYEPGDSPTETGLDEREYSDRKDEGGKQVLSGSG